MDRETRANLIFIAVFLAISLPGAVILFNKKLQPDARRMNMPDPVRQGLVFNDPTPAPDSVPRTAPAAAVDWLRSLAGVPEGRDAVYLDRASDMVQTADRRAQVLDLTVDEKVVRLRLLLWGKAAVHGLDEVGVVWVRDATNAAEPDRVMGEVEEAVAMDVPAGVVRALRDAGYVRPPGRVRVVTVVWDRAVVGGSDAASGAAWRVRRLATPGGSAVDLEVFPSLVSLTKSVQ